MGSQSSDDELSLDDTPDTSIEAPIHLSSGTPKPCPEFWFHDGSIVLRVENYLFRVHQTILSNHSEVFADLFAIPQPQVQEVIEGCHVVELHDHIHDMQDLLNAIYHPSYVCCRSYFSFYNPHTDTSINSPPMRLSTKSLTLYLESCGSVPNTLSAHSVNVVSPSSLPNSPPHSRTTWPSPAYRNQNATVLIQSCA